MDDTSHMGYSSSGRRSPCPCRRSRGFRLKYGKRFSVQRLRARFMSLFRVLKKLRRRYGHVLRLFRRGDRGCKNGECYFGSLKRSGSSRVWLVQGDAPCSSSACGLRYAVTLNTFHAEAISDCLEFIKGTYSAAN